ncbi:MAG TPA: SpoIIE family protein phosphatase [Luteibacter sp.]|jgi:sigma-B regulation protein RsbU (phosphoserine phosphatase)|nr:SpoIIE family protein phosphatase [Luteibacter sp.]
MVLRSIASRLALWVLAGSTLVLTATGGLLLVQTRAQILQQSHREAAALAAGASVRIQSRLDHVSDTAQMLAVMVASHHDDSASLIRDAIVANTDIAGISTAFLPSGKPPAQKAFAPFVRRDANGDVIATELVGEVGRYWEAPWFREAMHCPGGCWQPPFLPKGDSHQLLNYVVAIREAGQPTGVVSVDIRLDWLQQVLTQLDKSPGARAFVIGDDGVFLAHDRVSFVGTRASAVLREALTHPERSLVRLTPDQGARVDEPVWIYFVPIGGTHWIFGLVIPEGQIYADFRQNLLIDLGLGALALLGVALIALLATRRLMSPLIVLADRAEHVARGELDFELPKARADDEVGRLTHSFDQMRRELAGHIETQASTARAQQRLASELEIARQIQTALLPGEHYGGEDGRHVELQATVRPAREVGGDLYAYFMLDDQRFCVMVGDVSDKGVPAALFMARTITLAKTIAPQARSPQHILQLLNRELCKGNDSCMFVTLLCAVLDTASGLLSLASAGHEPPVLCGADAQLIPLETGPALGLHDDATYPSRQLLLHDSDTVLMYTDGVTEAQDSSHQLFGVQRMLDSIVGATVHASPADYVGDLLHAVDTYATGQAQADDITVLALRWRAQDEVMEVAGAAANR